MVCLCWINTKSANWFSAWNVYWPTREKKSSIVISSTKSWYSSQWRICSDQYLQWLMALNQVRGRFCFAHSRGILLRKLRCVFCLPFLALQIIWGLFIYLFLLFLLLTTGGSVLWLCVRALSIPPWRAEFSKYNYWNGSEFCWQQ